MRGRAEQRSDLHEIDAGDRHTEPDQFVGIVYTHESFLRPAESADDPLFRRRSSVKVFATVIWIVSVRLPLAPSPLIHSIKQVFHCSVRLKCGSPNHPDRALALSLDKPTLKVTARDAFPLSFGRQSDSPARRTVEPRSESIREFRGTAQRRCPATGSRRSHGANLRGRRDDSARPVCSADHSCRVSTAVTNAANWATVTGYRPIRYAGSDTRCGGRGSATTESSKGC